MIRESKPKKEQTKKRVSKPKKKNIELLNKFLITYEKDKK
tara:strand:- start:360 stop:479 length:120 start_codon:yes stop_codon:yes gene_type:complete